MRGLIVSAALLTAALGGCYTTGTVGYSGSATVYATTPDLVAVAPGVQVVADYDEPVFYTDGWYWRYYDGFWYRSGNYATGWVYVDRPPGAVLRIDRPYAYVRYRPRGYVVRNRARYRPAEVIVRDHRRPAYRAEPARDHRPVYRSEPVRRDYRAPAPRTEVREHRVVSPPPAAAPVRDHRDRDGDGDRDRNDRRGRNGDDRRDRDRDHRR